MRKILKKFKNVIPKEFYSDSVKTLENAVDLTIHTKAPEKWLLIDMETGQQYIGMQESDQYGKWKRIKDSDVDKNVSIWYNSNMMMPPCFYCENTAEYFGEVVEVNGVMQAIEVCKTHLKFQEASS